MDELPQRVLARRIPDRRQRHCAPYQVRRRRLRRHRKADPPACFTSPDPGSALPPPVDAPDTTPQLGLTPETYFGVGKVVNYAGGGAYDKGQADFSLSGDTADRHLRPAGPVGTRLPGCDGRQRCLERQAELPRQKRLHRRRRNRHPHGDARRENHDASRSAGRRRHTRSSPATMWPAEHSRCVQAKGCRSFPSPTADYRQSGTQSAPKPCGVQRTAWKVSAIQ